MRIDESITEALARLTPVAFEGSVFRATALNKDPTAASINGGRWAPRPNDEPGFPVLYTSQDRNGAMAEVASYLALQHPMPSKPLVVHELAVQTSKTIKLLMVSLEELGVDPDRYGERNYSRTQLIGAAINYLGIDGLISPSARWECNNLTIFMDNHALEDRLEIRSAQEVDWQAWAREHDLIQDLGKRG